MKRKVVEVQRVRRKGTAAEREHLRKARAESDAEKEEILRAGRRHKRNHEAALSELREAFRVLRQSREAQGMSLADVGERSGITRSALCRLENEIAPNPTVATLLRYAAALGQRIVIQLVPLENGE